MPLLDFDALFREADLSADRVPVAVAGGADRTVLEALRIAATRGWVAPIVVGQELEIRRVAEDVGVDLKDMTIVDTDEPVREAVSAVRSGKAKMLMKGQVATPDLMRGILDPETGLRAERAIGQLVLMEILRDQRRFLLADTGIMIRPSLAQKADILRSVVRAAQALGAEKPKVALMAATEKVVETMPETLHASELERRCAKGEFPECVVQGPLTFDLAYAADAAEKKRIGGEVVGAADAMIFPDLLSANLTVKAIMYTADCRFGGILLGTTHPVVFMSRADSTATRLHSLALALRLVISHES
jgi:phosphate butyryltransferase